MPEALVAVSYPVALGIYKAAKEKGITIPYDLKVICFGNYDYDFVAPSIFDFVSQPTEELGIKAVNLLFNLLNDPNKVTEKNIVLPTKLVLSSL
jgi:DNA-binding LacI/PurR family transcriptional regulator